VGALMMPAAAMAFEQEKLITIDPTLDISAQAAQAPLEPALAYADEKPAAAPAAEAPPEQVGLGLPFHLFFDATARTHYLTPRGLVVENAGVTVHAIGLIIYDAYTSDDGPINKISLIGGVWNCFLTNNDHNGNYAEYDPIISAEFVLFKDWTIGVTYVPFVVNDVGTENNIEFKIAYDDTKLLGDFALHPYVKPFWGFSGPSPVVLGETNSWDFELGIAPSFTLMKDTSLPITFTFPIFAALGDSKWYGGPSDGLGVFSAGVEASAPLTFMPKTLGFWKAHVGVQYFDIHNDTLEFAGKLVSGNSDSSVWVGSAGVSVFIP
jgi:hypothetical protein